MFIGQHAAHRLLRHQEAAEGGDRNRVGDVGRHQVGKGASGPAAGTIYGRRQVGALVRSKCRTSSSGSDRHGALSWRSLFGQEKLSRGRRSGGRGRSCNPLQLRSLARHLVKSELAQPLTLRHGKVVRSLDYTSRDGALKAVAREE